MRTKIRAQLFPFFIFLLILLINRFVLYIGGVPSSSMEPAIQKGQIIIGLRFVRQLSNGDIIIFRHDDKVLIKRIVACCGDTVYWNTEDISYVVNQKPAQYDRCLTVPADSYFVVGDNAEISIDSRMWDVPLVNDRDIVALYSE